MATQSNWQSAIGEIPIGQDLHGTPVVLTFNERVPIVLREHCENRFEEVELFGAIDGWPDIHGWPG